jgi:hypothetical protein
MPQIIIETTPKTLTSFVKKSHSDLEMLSAQPICEEERQNQSILHNMT